jgi:circadian clock protein KaiC
MAPSPTWLRRALKACAIGDLEDAAMSANATVSPSNTDRAATGIPGLDYILDGGFGQSRVHLIEGDPGTGKTTLALQFLLEAVRCGEKALYITLSETAEELRAIARGHGWSLDGIELVELTPPEASIGREAEYTLLHPSEVELGATTRLMFERVEAVQPARLVLDSLSELRLLAQDPLRYRRQVLALKQFFSGRDCTVLVLDDRTSGSADMQLHSITHGVITLEHLAREYGGERRRLRVVKMRGTDFRGGYHDFTIRTGGIGLFPRTVGQDADYADGSEIASSGIAELDLLLGGGLHMGTSTLLIGPAGAGKSSLATRYMVSSIARGQRAVLYTFDEGRNTLLERSAGLGMPLADYINSGRLIVRYINAAELSPGEFAFRVRAHVDDDGVRVVVIDSLNSYLTAMPAEQYLVLQMRELLSHLNRRGVLSLLVMAQHGLLGHMHSPIDLSYLTDNVILLRFFEVSGRVRKAISVVKKRSGAHEETIREFRLSDNGVEVGPPLTAFHGVLTGVPSYTGPSAPLLHQTNDTAR